MRLAIRNAISQAKSDALKPGFRGQRWSLLVARERRMGLLHRFGPMVERHERL
jgi:hypothetical protein